MIADDGVGRVENWMSIAQVFRARRETGKGWTRVHLIYFLLAGFDVLAVAAGLYLSSQFAGIFNRTIAVGQDWDRNFVELWHLGDLSDELGVPPTDVFDTRDAVSESRRFEEALTAFQQQLQIIEDDFVRSGKAGVARKAVAAIGAIEATLSEVAFNSRMVFSNYYNGWISPAAQSMSLADRAKNDLNQQLKTAISAIRSIKSDYEHRSIAEVRRLEDYQTLIGFGIVFTVCCVSFYGLCVGRLLSRKYQAIQDAYAKLNASQAESQRFSTELRGVNKTVILLNRELADSMTKLREAQDDILRKAKLAQLGQLTATVAHELRNPLSTVRAAAFLVERKLEGRGINVLPQLERINHGIVRCDTIISELLDFTRTRPLKREVLDVDGWLETVLAEQRSKLPSAVGLEGRYGLEGLAAGFDQSLMQRVVINLLSNASEAMVGRGHDPAAFTTSEPTIKIETRCSDRGIEIWCSDNGPGMTEETLKRIREPLFTTKSFGVGLGIPAVEKILDQHGGGLDIVTAPEAGTTMKAWFPLTGPRSKAA